MAEVFLSFSLMGFYFHSEKFQLQLHLSSVVEEFIVSKCRVLLNLRVLKDDQVKQVCFTTRSDHKWTDNTAT